MTDRAAQPRFTDVHPVIPARDVEESIAFYTEKLGFSLLWVGATDENGKPIYVGVGREGFRVHLQATVPGQSDAAPLIRIRTRDIDALYEEFSNAGVIHEAGRIADQPWGNREFGLYDPNNAGLIFYAPLQAE